MDLSVQTEKRNQARGKTISIIVHAILIVLIFINFMHPPDPPPGQAGILVSFGEPNIGQGEEVSAPPIRISGRGRARRTLSKKKIRILRLKKNQK